MHALYFDGRTAAAHPARLRLAGEACVLELTHEERQYRTATLRLQEPSARAPWLLDLPDGGHLEVAREAASADLPALLGYRYSRVERMQQRWWIALLSLVLLLALLGAIVEWGVPAAADALASQVSTDIDARLGDEIEDVIAQKLLAPSRLSDERLQQINQLYASLLPAAPQRPGRLLIRSVPRVGPNAFALPNGTIVLTDQMVLLLLPKNQWTPEGRARLAGVLAHELAHVARRHNLRALLRSSLTAAGAAALFGDFSTVAAGAPTFVTRMAYSRDMEREADRDAAALLRAHGLAPAALAEAFDALQRDSSQKAPLLNRLFGNMPYLSSHPPLPERAAALRR
ncbi:M48 family metallopeptidase [Massilia sp. TS11]|uniref:M48 family metallopeptidase n=1 Tax=Massilia sp. TS11 TaxID=2908003 RepID=UPI001EDB6F6A|nr:M48 family metallopeptidase [Massilia sp. TS11]MCG2582944.1 M48 family metallopeptidase [Massilia sp. TS11]